jgi:2-C-methyl-D-erythritol 4-phosphate cytidylyltransferase
MRNAAIILAAGSGSRFSSDTETPKQFCRLNGKRVVDHTIEAFKGHHRISEVYVTTKKKWFSHFKDNDVILVEGGRSRVESTYKTLKHIPDHFDNVLIHDAIRPFVSYELIERCVEALELGYEAVDTVIPSEDTLVELEDYFHHNKVYKVKSIHNIDLLLRGQTPQAFNLAKIKQAYRNCKNFHEFTDDIGVGISQELNCYAVKGSTKNIKITHPEDLMIAENIHKYLSDNSCKGYKDLRDKNFLVIGGSGGIGSAIRKELKKHKVCVVAPPKSEVDVRSTEWGFDQTFDGIVYAAGYINTDQDITVNSLYMMEVNFYGVIKAIDYARDHNIKDVLVIGSSSSSKGRAKFPMYSASKAALVNYIEAMIPVLSEEGIRLTCVNPVRTNTRMLDVINSAKVGSLDPDYVAKFVVNVLSSNNAGSVYHLK